MGAIMMANNVQSLHENKRKRGRPKKERNKIFAAFWSDMGYTSRSSLHNQMRAAYPGLFAIELGLADSDFRDTQTGKRMTTKLSELGRIYSPGFWGTPEGKDWMLENWRAMVDMPAAEFRQWVRRNNSRAKPQAEKELSDVLLAAIEDHVSAHRAMTVADVVDQVAIVLMVWQQSLDDIMHGGDHEQA